MSRDAQAPRPLTPTDGTAPRQTRPRAPRRSPRMSPRVRSLGCGLVALVLSLAGFFVDGGRPLVPAVHAKGKKSKKPKVSVQEVASQALLDKSDGVQDCAVKHALDKGSNRVEIDTTVTLDSRGTVVNIVTVVKLDKGNSTPVKDCVDSLVRTIRFPAIPAPLTTIERNWTIAN